MASVTSDDKPLTGVRKRQQIANANRQMFIWVTVAAVVVAVCAVVALNFVQRIIYQAKVNNKLTDTSSILTKSVATIDDLMANVDKLSVNKNLNLPQLRQGDSTAFQVVLDALPTENDKTSLGASLQDRILAPSGVTINQISVTSTGGAAAAPGDTSSSDIKPTAQPITFSVVVQGTYDSIQTVIQDIERTIRPITIDSVNLQGTDSKLQATISATTYFVPKVNYVLGSEEVKP